MNKQDFQSYEKEQYSIASRQITEQQTKLESIANYEISDVLNCRKRGIKKCLNPIGIKKSNVFAKRFERTYGKDAISTFKQIAEDTSSSLADAGRFFDFSREYARYVYKQIYGRPYTEAHKQKQIIIKARNCAEKMAFTKKIAYMMKAIKKMEHLGITANIMYGPPYLILANGYKLAFKVASKPVIVGVKQYYRFSDTGDTKTKVDFVVCLCKQNDKDIHFIIPSAAMPKSVVSVLPEDKFNKSKYTQFREAWHQIVSDHSGQMWRKAEGR